MRVTVAGGSGFLGSAIVDALVLAGHDVTVASRHHPRSGRTNPAARWRYADVTDPAQLPDALVRTDAVVDAVQFPNMPVENPARGYTFGRIDFQGTCNLVDAARTAGVKWFVGLSGVGAAPDAPFHWLRFKHQEEEHIRASGIPYVIFRPSWIYGPGDVSLNRFLGFARFLPFVPVIGDGKTRINPLFVDDIGAHVAATLGRDDLQGRCFEIGGPETLVMDEVIRTALHVMGKRRPLFHQPKWLMKAVGNVASRLPGRMLTADAIDFITMDGVADTTALVQEFGLPLTRLEDGLATYLRR